MSRDNSVQLQDVAVRQSKAVEDKNDGALFARVMDNDAHDQGKARLVHKPYSGDTSQPIIRENLPPIELVGFDREAPYKSEGTIKDAIHSVKHVFFSDPTLQEKIKEKVESQMSPQEKVRYEAENKALQEYKDKVRQWQMQESIHPFPMPSPPASPMHQEVDKRVQQVERQITESVRSKMSPEDIRRLNDQFSQLNKVSLENPCGNNPLADCIYRHVSKAEPENAIKDYYDRLAEETQKYLEQK